MFGIADFRGIALTPSSLRALLYCYSPRRDYARLLRSWMAVIPRGEKTTWR